MNEHPEYEELPGSDELRNRGYGGLGKAIERSYGGLPSFRELMRKRNGQPSGPEQLESLLESYAGRED